MERRKKICIDLSLCCLDCCFADYRFEDAFFAYNGMPETGKKLTCSHELICTIRHNNYKRPNVEDLIDQEFEKEKTEKQK